MAANANNDREDGEEAAMIVALPPIVPQARAASMLGPRDGPLSVRHGYNALQESLRRLDVNATSKLLFVSLFNIAAAGCLTKQKC